MYYCDDKFDSVITSLNKRGWKRDIDTNTNTVDTNTVDTIHKNATLLWTNLVSFKF